MPLDLMRRVIKHNATIIQQLYEALHQDDRAAVHDLLVDLDANNADMIVALEELSSCPPTRDTSSDEPSGDGRTG